MAPPARLEVAAVDALLDYAMAMRRRVELLADTLVGTLAELDEDDWTDAQDVLVYCMSDPDDEACEEWVTHQWSLLRRTPAQLVAERAPNPRP